MSTSTDNHLNAHHLIKQRWSPRAFGPEEVSEEQLQLLFEAARWAPSAMNEQPWRFIYATRQNEAAFEQLASCLVEGNSWAKKASALFISVAKTHYDFNGSENRHAWHDVGLATGNLLLQATELGLHVHLMGGYDAVKAKEVLGIPDGYEPVSMGAVGFLGDPQSLPDNLRAREGAQRQRKPLQEIAFEGKWKQK